MVQERKFCFPKGQITLSFLYNIILILPPPRLSAKLPISTTRGLLFTATHTTLLPLHNNSTVEP